MNKRLTCLGYSVCIGAVALALGTSLVSSLTADGAARLYPVAGHVVRKAGLGFVGVPGVRITAQAFRKTGGVVAASAVSGANGAWQVTMPAGGYWLVPSANGAHFHPGRKRLYLGGDRSALPDYRFVAEK